MQLGHCALCGHDFDPSRTTPAISTLPVANVTFVACSHCRTLTSTDAIAQARVLYEDRSSANFGAGKARWLLRLKSRLFRFQYAYLLHRLGIERVVDFGCGNGDLAVALHHIGFATHAVDVLPDRPAGLTDDIDYIPEAGFTGLVAGPRTAYILRHVLEHVTSPRETIAKLAGWMAPGDVILLEFPSRDSSFRSIMGRFWPGYYPPFHVTLLDDAEVVRQFEHQGATLVSRAPSEPPILAAFFAQRYGRLDNVVRLVGVGLYPLQWLVSKLSGGSEAVRLIVRR